MRARCHCSIQVSRTAFLLVRRGSPKLKRSPPVDPAALEALAQQKLTESGWLYAASNAGLSHTHLANRQAFCRHRLVPRTLVDTNARSTRAPIFGHDAAAPIGIAPIGINKIYHPLGELPVATVAGELGLPYCLSTAGSQPIEAVGAANDAGAKGAGGSGSSSGKGAARFFQLYMPHDDELTVSLLQRAWDSGFDALILTTDTWQLGWRHADVATSNYAFYKGIGADLGLSAPVFRRRLAARGIDPARDPAAAGAAWIDSVWHGRAWGWHKIPWLRAKWREISGGRPFCIKGIQSAADAERAVEAGCDGIVVSNHAGRQVDGAVASLDALESVVAAVGDRTYVMYDSGIRGAADVVKTLALGARFVFVGRLWIWGLSIMGEAGVRHVLKSLLADLDILMNVAGIRNVGEIDRSLIGTYDLPYTALEGNADVRQSHTPNSIYLLARKPSYRLPKANSIRSLQQHSRPHRRQVSNVLRLVLRSVRLHFEDLPGPHCFLNGMRADKIMKTAKPLSRAHFVWKPPLLSRLVVVITTSHLLPRRHAVYVNCQTQRTKSAFFSDLRFDSVARWYT